jgi:DNA (cytosine-5)-methyltransferase 1
VPARRAPERAPLRAVSLFTNCGAGDLGYAQAGFNFEVLAEIDKRRLPVAALNHAGASTVLGDLRKTWPQVVETFRERAGDAPPALLAACPPCQGMSSARGDRGDENDAEAGSRDARNLLVTVIARVVHAFAPRIVVVENVAAFLTRNVKHPRTKEPVSAALLLVRSLHRDYRAFPLLCDLADYGVPQIRERAFLVFVHRDEPIADWLDEHDHVPFPTPTHGPEQRKQHVTLAEALRALGAPSLDARSAETAGNGYHAVPVWDERRYALAASIPPHTGKGAWTNATCPSCGSVEVDANATACPLCARALARPVVPDEKGGYRFISGFRTSSYTRMRPDVPAATITTASGFIGSDKTIHPWENRVLSPRECAHLQTFPPSFRWGDTLAVYGPSNVRRMIGEAVPPRFTRAHGVVLRALLEGRPPWRPLPASDARVAAAAARLKRAARDTAAGRGAPVA